MDKEGGRQVDTFLFQDDSLVMPEEGAPILFRGLSPEIIKKNFVSAVFFATGSPEDPLTAAYIPPKEPLPQGWKALPLRHWLSQVSAGTIMYDPLAAGSALRAFHIVQWRAESRFCGSCGTANADAPDELARLCPACGRREYPRISPAVITIVINDEDKALLAHNNKFADGMYSLVAGFTEAGESLEGAVEREILEEVNLKVTGIRYIASQPWPFPNSLMLGFACRCAGGEIRPDGREISDAKWFSRDSLPLIPGFGSVSRYLINLWMENSL
ncbi:MAG: NAD(+) diphosphatase [Treponema sp.]|jgi:NAD+ diphosphatase|nr:NAD(+) diphosphatase [Treponema sp.]